MRAYLRAFSINTQERCSSGSSSNDRNFWHWRFSCSICSRIACIYTHRTLFMRAHKVCTHTRPRDHRISPLSLSLNLTFRFSPISPPMLSARRPSATLAGLLCGAHTHRDVGKPYIIYLRTTINQIGTTRFLEPEDTHTHARFPHCAYYSGAKR